jgi:hypothetical protein
MSVPSVTYTFIASTPILAGHLNTNFTDCINAVTDGLKDITIASLTAGSVSITAGTPLSAGYFLPTTDPAGDPVANALYKKNVPKAWAHLTCGAGGAVTVTNGFNIDSASYVDDVMTVVFKTNMANVNYCVFPMSNIMDRFVYIGTLLVGSFEVKSSTPSTGLAQNWSVSLGGCFVSVFGDQ